MYLLGRLVKKNCVGRICRVVIDEGTFIQHRQSVSEMFFSEKAGGR